MLKINECGKRKKNNIKNQTNKPKLKQIKRNNLRVLNGLIWFYGKNRKKKPKCNGTIERMSIEVIVFKPSEPKVTIENNILYLKFINVV